MEFINKYLPIIKNPTHIHALVSAIYICLQIFSPNFYLYLRKYTLVKLAIVFIFIWQSGGRQSGTNSLIWTVLIYAFIIILEYLYERFVFYSKQEKEEKNIEIGKETKLKTENRIENEIGNELGKEEIMYIDPDNEIIF